MRAALVAPCVHILRTSPSGQTLPVVVTAICGLILNSPAGSSQTTHDKPRRCNGGPTWIGNGVQKCEVRDNGSGCVWMDDYRLTSKVQVCCPRCPTAPRASASTVTLRGSPIRQLVNVSARASCSRGKSSQKTALSTTYASQLLQWRAGQEGVPSELRARPSA